MNNKNGFTLLELLIAAAIIGVLAIFAIQSFQVAAADTRVEDARARAKIVAAAAHRFMLEYPSVSANSYVDDGNSVITPADSANCALNIISVQNLVNCGYLEYRQYNAETREGENYKRNFTMTFEPKTVGEDVVFTVCVQGATIKITKHDNTKYCTDGDRWY